MSLQHSPNADIFRSLWGAILGNVVYVLISVGLWLVTGEYGRMHVAAVGYSGVLFAYAALESYHTTTSVRSFYGCFDVPSKVYPWLLLVAIQVVLPNVSFIGHLAGMLFGLFLIAGGDMVLIPSAEYLQQLESSSSMSCV